MVATGRWLGAAGVIACVGIACSKGATGPNGHGIADVIMTPDTVTVAVGDSTTIQARPVTASGAAVGGMTLFWSTDDPSIATVDQQGRVTAVAVGAVNVDASVAGISPKHPARVIIGDRRVVVTPAAATVYATTPGNAVDLTETTVPAGGTVTWSDGGATVALVDANGRVTATGTAAGSATITATSTNSTASGSATITVIGHVQTVTPNPGSTALGVIGAPSTTATATLTDTFGTDVSSQRRVTWTSSDPETITINNSTSPVVAGSGATSVTLTAVSTHSRRVTITATTDDGVSGSVIITVDL